MTRHLVKLRFILIQLFSFPRTEAIEGVPVCDQMTSNHSLCPVARVAKKHVSLRSIDIDFHILSNRIGQNIKLRPHTIETNLGERSVPSSNRSVVKSVFNIVVVYLIE
jgi:hypothetical protein